MGDRSVIEFGERERERKKMVIKTELVVSFIKNAIFESRKSRGTHIERFIKLYPFIDTRF